MARHLIRTAGERLNKRTLREGEGWIRGKRRDCVHAFSEQECLTGIPGRPNSLGVATGNLSGRALGPRRLMRRRPVRA